MRAAWYERQGPADQVLQIGELPLPDPDPEPGPGEVRVRLHLSGVNPGDTKKREGFFGSSMAFPRLVPHSDGAGVIDRVGAGVGPARVGRRVWVFGTQSYQAFGTAAEYTTVPSELAVDLPDGVDDAVGACLGIPGITAHRCVFADGPVSGATVPVHGVAGGVGSLAAAHRLPLRIASPYPLADIAAAPNAVDAGARDERVLVDVAVPTRNCVTDTPLIARSTPGPPWPHEGSTESDN